jgi:radical SAM superfamily enzyme YgiQ (UPF0313 family)
VDVLDPPLAHALTGAGASSDPGAGLALLLERERYDAAGIAIYSPLRREALELARAIKHKNRRTWVIAGGSHPTRLWKSLLSAYPRLIDYACLGAAEASLPALLQALAAHTPAAGIKGLALLAGDLGARPTSRPLLHAPLADLPPVRYDRLLEKLPGGKIPRAYTVTVRGCSNWCNFCSNIWKKPLARPARQVLDEVRYLVEECGTRELVLYDDAFGMKKDQALEILRGIQKLGADLRLQAVTRFDLVDEELLGAFADAGGRDLLLGLETGSAQLRRRMNKHLPDGLICEALERIRRHSLRVAVHLMFGYPGETAEDFEATRRILEKIAPEQTMSTVFDIKPGDMMIEWGLRADLLQEKNWLDLERPLINYQKEAELLVSAGAALLFDERFTREIIVPEHDGADLILGWSPERANEAKALAREALQWR